MKAVGAVVLVALLLGVAFAEEEEKPGVKITVVKEGDDCTKKTASGDMIKVHYTGTLADGTKFDSSRDRQDPFTLKLGRGMVIQGWEDGLLDMCVGEQRKLEIPPHLGYGEHGSPPVIPENADLVFDVELMEIRETTGDEADEYDYGDYDEMEEGDYEDYDGEYDGDYEYEDYDDEL